jgi:hypothetical protein
VRVALDKGDAQALPGQSHALDVTLANAQTSNGNRFLIVPGPSGVISGVMFDDVNKNSYHDAYDAPVRGRRVFFDLDLDGRFDAGEPSTTTDELGRYAFTALRAGGYNVAAEPPSGYREINPQPSHWVSLLSRQKETLSFLLTTRPLVRGDVFEDRNGNRLRESATEPRLAGWQVYADLNDNEKFDDDEPVAFSYADGWALDLPSAGTFLIRVVPRAGYKATTPRVGLFRVTVAAGGVKENLQFGERIVG